jgi:hypothetical protein
MFEELMHGRGKELERLQATTRLNLGSHKRTRRLLGEIGR